jgi:sugar phosphate isomerase/epimerase
MRVTRRAWLQSTIVCSCGGWGAHRVRADDPPAAGPGRISFGFSLYGMKTIAPLAAIKIIADIGYNGVELPVMADWPCAPETLTPADRRDVRSALTDWSVDLPALMENLPLLVEKPQQVEHRQRLQRAMQLAHDLAPDQPPLIETVLGGAPGTFEQVRDPLADELLQWSRLAAAQEVVIAVKPHVNNACRTPNDALWLMEQVNSPWIRLAFDYSHFERQQLTLPRVWNALQPHTAFVHIKDNRQIAPGKYEFILPGDGGTNYTELLQLLRRDRYHGAVVVEVSQQVWSKPGYEPIVAAERCYLKLFRSFEQAGLKARI